MVEADNVDIQTLNACRPGLGVADIFLIPKKVVSFRNFKVLGKNALKKFLEGGMLPSFFRFSFFL